MPYEIIMGVPASADYCALLTPLIRLRFLRDG
jgi:hypothetical protein